MSNVVRPSDVFPATVPPQPKFDMFGKRLEVGQVVVYEGSGRSGMALYEVTGFTAKLILATRLSCPSKSRLHFPDRAIILPESPSEARRLIREKEEGNEPELF